MHSLHQNCHHSWSNGLYVFPDKTKAYQFLDEPSGIAERDCCNIYNKVRV